MHKIAKIALITNLTLVVLFVVSNVYLWSQINGNGYSLIVNSVWNPLTITATHFGYAINGEFTAGLGIFQYPNLPFWIFFAAIVINAYFITYVLNKANMH